jgi:hypothetical protein
VRDSPLPDLGPLIALAFDKTVTIAAGRWKLLLVVLLLSTAGGYFGVAFAFLPSLAFTTYWAFACYANAVRLERPEYRMTAVRVLTLVGLSILLGLLIEIGLLLFVVPGVYVGTKYSMAAIVAVTDDVGVNEAATRSWSLTASAFWNTLGFNVVLYFAMIALSIIGYVIGVFVLTVVEMKLIVASGGGHIPTPAGEFVGPFGAVVGLFICAYMLAVSFGYQAHAIAQLYWLRALERRASALAAAAVPATA